MARIGACVFQGHLDALFAHECREVKRWVLPEGSQVRAQRRHLETDVGRLRVRRHGVTLAGEKARVFL